jgi:DNA-binding Lrp family transcriptional regulator
LPQPLLALGVGQQDDARVTNRELASRVHVSTSTSSERTRALHEAGVISGYHASVAMDALGRHVQALIAITIRPPTRQHIEGFRNWAADLPEVMSVFVVSGGSDFLLHVGVPDTDALYAFVIDRLTQRRQVAAAKDPTGGTRRSCPRPRRRGRGSAADIAHHDYEHSPPMIACP